MASVEFPGSSVEVLMARGLEILEPDEMAVIPVCP